MFNFLKQEIAKKEQARKAFHVQEADTPTEMDEAILEYAHLFTEMHELTHEGTNVHRERPIINIPIENDIELDLVEMDITSGRIVDVPMDVQSVSTVEAFRQEKTYEDFYQEAMRTTPRFQRESDQLYDQRITRIARKNYTKYHNYIVQEGLFGNEMLDISDERIPSSVIVDLGPLHENSTKHYITKLPVYFKLEKNKIHIDQIHTLNVASNLHAFEQLGPALRDVLVQRGDREIVYRNEIWDIATPHCILVPTCDWAFLFIIEFEVEGLKSTVRMEWWIDKKEIRMSKNGKIENKEALIKKSESNGANGLGTIKLSDKDTDSMEFICKKDYEKVVKEAATNWKPNRWHQERFFQEAIDFGGDAGNPITQDPAPDTNDMPPTTDTTDPSLDPNGVGDDAPSIEPNENAATATTNDISQQIANNVASATAANTNNTDIMNSTPTFDTNVDDTFNSLDGAMSGTDAMDQTESGADNLDTDVNTTDTSTDAGMNFTDPTDPSSELDQMSMDTPNSNDDTTQDMNDNTEIGGIDLDNMSMDDMINQGIEKLKTMPMSQLKEFLNDGSGAIGTGSSPSDGLSLEYAVNTDVGAISESAVDIGNELDVGIRKILGDLNDEKKSLKDIFHSVKKDSKQLNKSISKALKSQKFDQKSVSELTDLAHSLNDMILKLNDTPIREEIEGIKTSIRNFTGSARRVSKVIDFGKKGE